MSDNVHERINDILENFKMALGRPQKKVLCCDEVTVTIGDVTLEVLGYFHRESRGRWSEGQQMEPDEDAYFEIEQIQHEGTDLMELLSMDTIQQIQAHCNEKAYEHFEDRRDDMADERRQRIRDDKLTGDLL